MFIWLVPALVAGFLYFAAKSAKGLLSYVLWIATIVTAGYALTRAMYDPLTITLLVLLLALFVTYKVIKRRRKKKKEHEERERSQQIHIHNHYNNP